jgi:predicted PurR-regulated permease PerM
MNKFIRPAPRDIIESILVLLLLLALMLALYDVLRVFFGVLTFALIFSVSFAGLYERLVKHLRNRRKLGAVIYSIVLVSIVAVPLVYIFSSFSRRIKDAIVLVNEIKDKGLPPLPAWISHLPLVGDELSSFWLQLQMSPKETFLVHSQQLKIILHHIVTSGVGILGATLQVVIGIFISAVFLVRRELLLSPVKSALKHLLGEKTGLSLLEATTIAIKSVSVGVMGAAFIAAIISWIGLTIAGIPFALGLSAIIFFLVLIQLGPLFVWIPLVIWMSTQGHPGTTVFLIIYGIALVIMDFILKPVLIGKTGGKIPFLVLFLGVIGGIAAWGFTGMFKGAIILTVFYTIFTSWLERKNIKNSDEPIVPAAG